MLGDWKAEGYGEGELDKVLQRNAEAFLTTVGRSPPHSRRGEPHTVTRYSGRLSVESVEGSYSTRCCSTWAGCAIHTAPMATTAAIAAAAKAAV